MKVVNIALVALLPLLTALPAHAFGTANGGGGKGVVCRNPDGTVRSVQLMDLWEAAQLRGTKPLATDADLPTLVNGILGNLKDAGGNTTEGDGILRELKEVAARFLDEKNSTVVRLSDARLDLTNDSDELIQPRECQVEQIVDYQPVGARALIDQTLFEKMDNINKASLIAHESLYAFLRQFEDETNSVRVRRAVSEVVSTGKPLSNLPKLAWEDGQITCYSPGQAPELVGGGEQETVLVFSKDKMQIDFRSLLGELPIGNTEASRKPTSPWMPYFPAAFFGDTDCKAWSFTFGLDGPVEYDTTIVLYKDCKDGQTVRRIGIRKPGQKQLTVSPLTCRPLKDGEWGNE